MIDPTTAECEARTEAAIDAMRAGVDVLEPMELDRAKTIVQAVVARSLLTLGIGKLESLPSLKGVSLDDMIRAAARLRHHEEPSTDGKGKRFYVIPDDRLIAAVYTLEHYHPGGEAIAVRRDDDGRTLGIVVLPIGGSGA